MNLATSMTPVTLVKNCFSGSGDKLELLEVKRNEKVGKECEDEIFMKFDSKKKE